MKYFIDTEFIEDFHKPRFGKRRHFIDLISIGIIAEDNRTYYAISNEFDLKAVWNKYDLKPDIDNGGMKKVYWLRENVLKSIYNKIWHDNIHYGLGEFFDMEFSYKSFKSLLKSFGKSNKQIAEEVEWFIRRNHHVNCTTNELVDDKTHQPVSFYGYYADYDWVLFCSLFGRMIDLPDGFPMYCIDLKQMLDEKCKTYSVLDDKNLMVEFKGVMPEGNIKLHLRYPKQTNEHNALSDAKWNYELYKFLNIL